MHQQHPHRHLVGPLGRSKATILIVTHNMGQAKRAFSKFMFMYLGELVEYDDTETMFTNPKDERTKAYLTGKMG
jgi:phosphate transport system ATP-binding protein